MLNNESADCLPCCLADRARGSSFKPLADQPRDDRRQMIGAAARGATWLLLASNVQPVAGVVSSLVTNSALRLTPASVSGAAARPPLSRTRMQSTWTTGVDETSGATYYYNEQTGESQWESPQQENHGAAEVVWRVAGLRGVDAGHTLRSGDERVLSRWNMLNQKLTVSRKQGVVRCLADGTATLTSEGRGPTLWREHGGMSKTRPTRLWPTRLRPTKVLWPTRVSAHPVSVSMAPSSRHQRAAPERARGTAARCGQPRPSSLLRRAGWPRWGWFRHTQAGWSLVRAPAGRRGLPQRRRPGELDR